MANKIRIWSTKELEDMNLFDTTPRAIRGSEIVSVHCRVCNTVGQTKLSNIRSKISTYRKTWQCSECLRKENSERGKTLIGYKNPFSGKRHSLESQRKMSESSRKRWDNTPLDTRNQIGVEMRSAAYTKYGGNPMSDPEVRQKYLYEIKVFFENTERVKIRSEKQKATNLERYGNESYLQSEHFEMPKTSRGELEIKELFPGSRKRRKDNVEIDIFDEKLMIGIEYNGCYYHSEIYRHKDYHLKKTEYCETQGIQLIQIFDHEWEKRKPQITNFLLSKQGKLKSIGARKCKLITVTDEIAQNFVEEYHIQGRSPGSILCLGLELNGELVSVAIFGRHHRQNKKTVLKRFVSKNGIVISGALSKLSKHASNILKTDIITWADRRWTNGQSYTKAGWEIEEVLKPDYFYIKNGRYHCSKQARKKKLVGTPKNQTEHEHALSDNLLRVYDAGKFRLIYRFTHPRMSF